MKFFSVFCIALSAIFGVSKIHAQKSPVSWDFELNKISDDQYELVATATMQKSWVLYSQFTDDNGPIPTQFYLDDKIFKMEEKSKAIKEHDEMFDIDVIKFKEKSIFTTKISRAKTPSVKGFVTYMTCDGSKCLPPVDAAFDLKY